MTRQRLTGTCAVLALIVLVGWMAPGEAAVLTDPPMQSIGALEFADGVLFAGDSIGGAIYALEVGSDGEAAGEFAAVDGLDTRIAEMLGTTASDVFIKDLAVDPMSGAAYLSIMRGDGADAQPVLMKVTPDGGVHHVDLAGLSYTVLTLGDAPANTPGERRNPRTQAITDIELVGDELYIAGLSNEEFASSMRRAAWPFADNARATGLEIYHGAHGQFETHAPVYTFVPVDIDGAQHVLAGYLCTPLVTFSVDEMRTADRMRGKTIAELGFGNVPIDMLQIDHEGDSFILMTNSRRGTMKIPLSDIRDAQTRPSIEERVGPRTGVDYEGAPLGLVVQVDKLNDGAILVLERQPENGALRLSARENRWI